MPNPRHILGDVGDLALCPSPQAKPMPSGPVSLWDMLKFYGSRFVKALDDLSAIRAIAMTVKGKHLDPETRASVLGHMRDLSVQLHVMGLNLTRMSLMRLIGKIDSDPELDARVEHLLSEIQLRLQDELEDTLLFSIPTNAHLFRQSEPIFGSEVEKKFGAASFDISEAPYFI